MKSKRFTAALILMIPGYLGLSVYYAATDPIEVQHVR